MPPDHGGRSNEDEGVRPVRPQLSQQYPQQLIPPAHPGTSRRPLQHCELVTEGGFSSVSAWRVFSAEPSVRASIASISSMPERGDPYGERQDRLCGMGFGEAQLDFLHDLEVGCHNIVATRNVRLAAIHAFFRYCAAEHPDRMPAGVGRAIQAQSLGSSCYLEFAEIQAVLAAIDRATSSGRRDYALLVTMFNAGARVQEIVALRVANLRLEAPPHLRLLGKGRKERICPLWSQTAELLRALLLERGGQPRPDQSLFVNHRGEPLTRFGVRYIPAKYCAQARETTPTLATKRLHPHSMRHSTAVHLLRSGVDIVTISQWLGHASVTTTNRYATVDLEMKRKAIESARRPMNATDAGVARWRSDASILQWLEAL
jgi:integrase/recombinase XerD